MNALWNNSFQRQPSADRQYLTVLLVQRASIIRLLTVFFVASSLPQTEWTNFMSSNAFSFRACVGEGAADYCQHVSAHSLLLRLTCARAVVDSCPSSRRSTT